MAAIETTCWTLIEAAARGSANEREQFAQHYLGPIRAYLMARWQSPGYRQLVDDAVQEVFVECLRPDGPLMRVDQQRTGNFRAYLFGVVRNVARRVESRQAADRKRTGQPVDLHGLVTDETSLSKIFDRAWAQSIMRQARDRQREVACQSGEEALRRVELLRLRFEEGLAIREIADQWQMDPSVLHHQYSKARKEFREALIEVVAFHHPGSDGEIEREAAALLSLLG
jgi:RNA polymerase sigma factor (sigma-70 family)